MYSIKKGQDCFYVQSNLDYHNENTRHEYYK